MASSTLSPSSSRTKNTLNDGMRLQRRRLDKQHRTSKYVFCLRIFVALGMLSVAAMWFVSLRRLGASSAMMVAQLHAESLMAGFGGLSSSSSSALQAFDLSVNDLQAIPFEPELTLTRTPQQHTVTDEDFLPIVVQDNIQLKFRLRPTPGASPEAMRDIRAYQIIARHAHGTPYLLWDSGKVPVDTMPVSIEWGGNTTNLQIGTIVQWGVLVWDYLGKGPSLSMWSKFAVGPSMGEWTGQWITHPTDYDTLEKVQKTVGRVPATEEMCNAWKQRRPLPLARAHVTLPIYNNNEKNQNHHKKLQSALLVVSGLGSFMVTLDGNPLSSSSLQDPPLTDYSQRVSYRGYDVTKYLLNQQQHPNQTSTIGISLGSGWWDGLPLNGKIVFQDLMPKGPLTTIAELHVIYQDGTKEVLIPTNDQESNWQMGKGHIVESNLYTGETINVATLFHNSQWDAPLHDGQPTQNESRISWMTPKLYKAGASFNAWHSKLQQYAYDHEKSNVSAVAPIGRLVPIQIPPVMPLERIAPDSIQDLGNGRWLYDFGKGFAGVVRFESGLPAPIRPPNGTYPRGHNVTDFSHPEGHDAFITVVYGDSIELTTGDINTVLVAGYGYHNGGPRRVAGVANPDLRAGPCWPKDHGKILLQRDVYIIPNSKGNDAEMFAHARQSRFTFHGFRYAEVCCTQDAPHDVYAIKYRSRVQEWGSFDSSNTVLNGAYEMTKNAFDSNMLSVQSDCPHREKLQYGGDIVANSPAALHMYDTSAWYRKIIQDWTESQWDNGGYTTTSVFMDILRRMSIGGRGSGETVWASVAPVMTARHYQNYGDIKLLESTLVNHVKWMDFLGHTWDEGMEEVYPDALSEYNGGGSGLGDWLALMPRDCWLTHHAFYLASVRAVLYTANKLQQTGKSTHQGLNLTAVLRKASSQSESLEWIVDGNNRCKTLASWLTNSASGAGRRWSGTEERYFHQRLQPDLFEAMKKEGRLVIDKRKKLQGVWATRSGINSGILDIKYTFKTLSDMGFHDVALSKVSSSSFPGYGYMMSFNATTLWETWWRSEDLYSRNHPMFGAIAEWMSSSVAGVSLSPTTSGGQELIFWPRIPRDMRVLEYASAIHGTKRGEAAVAWQFRNHADGNQHVQVYIRILVPASSQAILHLEPRATKVTMKIAKYLPNIQSAKSQAEEKCNARRSSSKYGFPYHFQFDREKEEWTKVYQSKSLGTPCESFLWNFREEIQWLHYDYGIQDPLRPSIALQPGLFEIVIDEWELNNHYIPKEFNSFEENINKTLAAFHCQDPSEVEWNVNDAVHLM